MNQIFTRILTLIFFLFFIGKTSLFGQSSQPTDGSIINKDNGKKIWSYSDVFNKYQDMYKSDSLINKVIIFVIICIVSILIFFLYNIYDGKKVSRKQSFF